jgi:hypothetical protein
LKPAHGGDAPVAFPYIIEAWPLWQGGRLAPLGGRRLRQRRTAPGDKRFIVRSLQPRIRMPIAKTVSMSIVLAATLCLGLQGNKITRIAAQ